MTFLEEIAQRIDKALDGDCGYGVGEHLAEQLSPLIAEHDARVQAETLREAAEEADEWKAADGMHGGEWFPSEWAGQVAGWLEHRAARIEKEADQ